MLSSDPHVYQASMCRKPLMHIKINQSSKKWLKKEGYERKDNCVVLSFTLTSDRTGRLFSEG